ncbi:MAG: endo-1,4-beta-xylanase [Bacteroidota bacterium]
MRSLFLLFTILLVTLNSYSQQTIPIDDFEDGDLIANNWANWRVYCYPENNNGTVSIFRNEITGGTKAVRARFNTGTGAYVTAGMMLKFSGLSGLDMHKYSQVRFKAKGSAYPIEMHLECKPITDYSWYRTTAGTLTSNWQQFTVNLATLAQPSWTTQPVNRDSALNHAWSFDFNIAAPTGVNVDLWIDDVEFITNPAYQYPPLPVLPVGLKQAAQAANIELGFAISPDYIGDSLCREVIRQNAMSITSEWGPLMAEIKRYPDRYDFSMADATIKWAHINGIKVKGEHLVWHLSDPAWIQYANYTSAQTDSMMQHFIQTTINYYKTNYPGTLTHWCVVNEAIDDNTCSYRTNFWYNKLGKNYIAKAFDYARQADPTIKLYYNDYGADGAGLPGNASRKADSLYNIIKHFKQQGVPIDGVGLQMHVSLENFPGKAAVLAQMNRLGALGLEVYITEIDVTINENLSGPSALKFQQQAQVYCDALEACIASPHCKDYTIWGITDRYSWIEQFFNKTDWPLITDFNYQTKDAWDCIWNTLTITTAVQSKNNSSASAVIYPNPATNKIVIESNEQKVLDASIYNMLGELVFKTQLNIGINEIDVSTFSKGIYVIMVTGEQVLLQQKLIKE